MKTWLRNLAAIITYCVALLSPQLAQGEELKAGDRAPDFSLPGSDGKTYSLPQLKGKTVVLAWFPKAFTGG